MAAVAKVRERKVDVANTAERESERIRRWKRGYGTWPTTFKTEIHFLFFGSIWFQPLDSIIPLM